MNISGNSNYRIDMEEGYVVNIDNFFKMCLITQRMRLNIPIVVMGEAGIGKTALLRHVVKYLYKHEFAVYNINAGILLEGTEKLTDTNQSQLSDREEGRKEEKTALNTGPRTLRDMV
jgi:GTPase SAR1 family protein